MLISEAFRNIHRMGEIAVAARDCPHWLKLLVGYGRFKKLTYPFEVRTRYDARMELGDRFDLITFWIIFFRKEYPVRKDFKQILDIGANIGAFTVYACHRAPGCKVIAVEPFPKTREALKRNISKNNLDDRVIVISNAIAGREQTRFMPEGGPSHKMGLLQPGADRGTQVQTITLSSLIQQHNITDADLLKMDIEGGEHEVFPTLSADDLRRFKNIALEYHPNGSSRRLFDQIIAAGFRLVNNCPSSTDSGVAHFERLSTRTSTGH